MALAGLFLVVGQVLVVVVEGAFGGGQILDIVFLSLVIDQLQLFSWGGTCTLPPLGEVEWQDYVIYLSVVVRIRLRLLW